MPGTTPILTLRICNIGFRKLAKGEIAYKYREVKPFRTSRLLNEKGEPKYFEEIHIKNGYQPNSPVAIYELGGVIGEEVHEGKLCYKIKLGKLKEIKNFKE